MIIILFYLNETAFVGNLLFSFLCKKENIEMNFPPHLPEQGLTKKSFGHPSPSPIINYK